MKVNISFEVRRASGVEYNHKVLDVWLAKITHSVRANRFVENWKIKVTYDD